ncbi:hypothetical protein ACFSCZ_16520 [Siminovitchia sediminis]|uniref:Uncharacterized protein n=1 Tax=Siminovitchia sediminis TaxID=1274353 RepID=A0ABW4KK80_9BACI
MAVQLETALSGLALPFLSAGLIAGGRSSSVLGPLVIALVLAGLLFGRKADKSNKRFLGVGNLLSLCYGCTPDYGPVSLIIIQQPLWYIPSLINFRPNLLDE